MLRRTRSARRSISSIAIGFVMLISMLVGFSAAPASALPVADAGYSWGSMNGYALGMRNYWVTTPEASTMVGIPAASVVTQFDSSGYTTCVVASGALYCTGSNDAGQLGTGDHLDSPIYLATNAGGLAGKTVTQVSTANYYACALTDETTDNLYCWGDGTNGQLGQGDLNNHNSPVNVNTGALAGKHVTQVEVGGDVVCAVTDEATANVYCWGGYYWGANGRAMAGRTSSPGDLRLPALIDFSGALSGKQVVKIMLGGRITCALTTEAVNNGYCWGDNSYGVIGDGLGATTYSPHALSAAGDTSGLKLVDITSGQSHTCAVDSAGHAYCWGWNQSGQLGINSTSNQSVPVEVLGSGALAGKTLTRIVSDFNMTCAYDSAGAGYCWGQGNEAMGDGGASGGSSLVAVPMVMPTGVGFSQPFLASSMACAMGSDSVFYCWGDLSSGGVGDGTTYYRTRPAAIVNGELPAGRRFEKLSAGYSFSCGLSLGEIYCWGTNDNGQLGNGTTTTSFSPVKVDMTGDLAGKTIVDVKVGDYTACALDDAGALYCWGYGSDGEIGNGATSDQYLPTAVDMSGMGGAVFASVSVGSYSVCGVTTTGTIWCWGYNYYNVLGTGDSTDRSVPTQVDTTNSGAAVFTSVSTNSWGTCAIDSASGLWCWGTPQADTLTQTAYTTVSIPTYAKTAPLAGKTLTSLSVGYYSVCLLADGAPYCSGDNGYGGLGVGDTNSYSDAVAVDLTGALAGKTITQIVAGGTSSGAAACVLDSTGLAYCWGYNDSGRLGRANVIESYLPEPVVQGTTRFQSLSMGQDVVLGTRRLPEFTVTIATGGTGTGTVSTSTTTLQQGSAFSSTASATGGSSFSGWTCTPNSYDTASATLSFTVTEDVSCTASFALPQYAVTIATAGTGSGSVSQTTQTLDSGSTFTSVATANAGSTFAGWTCTPAGYGTANATLTFTVSEAVSCTATFTLATPPPSGQTVTSIAPNHSKLSGGVKVTVTGTGFTSRTKVYVDGKEVKIKSRTGSTKFTFETPSAKRTGWVSVRVVTGGSTTTVAQGIYYDPNNRRG